MPYLQCMHRERSLPAWVVNFVKLGVGFTGSGETLNKGGIPVFLLLCLKKEEARGREA
jgi:hypothetical protein